MNKLVREAFAPRGDEPSAGRPGGLRSAIARTIQTAQALWKRDRLTADQYVCLTEMFTAHGALLPPNGSGSGVGSF
ncbi:hypothetical protein [Streptomyces sp. NPDC012508]|uniref:hypothetical protein n=1 Tax=Streptomyces sp. NPDC012508 TaxID=3364837 RepID=UPI00368A9B99